MFLVGMQLRPPLWNSQDSNTRESNLRNTVHLLIQFENHIDQLGTQLVVVPLNLVDSNTLQSIIQNMWGHYFLGGTKMCLLDMEILFHLHNMIQLHIALVQTLWMLYHSPSSTLMIQTTEHPNQQDSTLTRIHIQMNSMMHQHTHNQLDIVNTHPSWIHLLQGCMFPEDMERTWMTLMQLNKHTQPRMHQNMRQFPNQVHRTFPLDTPHLLQTYSLRHTSTQHYTHLCKRMTILLSCYHTDQRCILCMQIYLHHL